MVWTPNLTRYRCLHCLPHHGNVPSTSTFVVLSQQENIFWWLSMLIPNSQKSTSFILQLLKELSRNRNVFLLHMGYLWSYPFTSSEFEAYMAEIGVKHQRITPLWPLANLEAENLHETIDKNDSCSTNRRKDWKTSSTLSFWIIEPLPIR